MKCIACGAPADERLCPDCRAEVDARAREMVEERLSAGEVEGVKRLRGYTRASWARQIDGVSVSLWITPSWKYAYLYENGARYVAKDAEEQAEIHRTLGLPEVEGDFETGLRRQMAGVRW